MDALKHYFIPIQGLEFGIHNFDFDINESFFEHFDQSPITTSDLKVNIAVNKKPGVMGMTINVEGTILTPCDRCLTDIHLPIKGSYPMLIKDSDEPSDDVDVVHVSGTQRKLFVSQFIYEFILASVPIIKTYDCDADEPRPCDDSTLEKLDSNQDTEASNPLWDQLQNFKDN